MIRSNLRRGVTAVVFVAALAVAGAQPAAAEGFGWRETWDWLSGLWGGVTLLQPATSADTVDVGPEIDPNGNPSTNGDCGPEIDPNGHCGPTGG